MHARQRATIAGIEAVPVLRAAVLLKGTRLLRAKGLVGIGSRPVGGGTARTLVHDLSRKLVHLRPLVQHGLDIAAHHLLHATAVLRAQALAERRLLMKLDRMCNGVRSTPVRCRVV